MSCRPSSQWLSASLIMCAECITLSSSTSAVEGQRCQRRQQQQQHMSVSAEGAASLHAGFRLNTMQFCTAK
jgi:hypothetical protein